MTTSARYAQTVLTDDSTADLAAGALGATVGAGEDGLHVLEAEAQAAGAGDKAQALEVLGGV
mgnify:CR=1 FL=1